VPLTTAQAQDCHGGNLNRLCRVRALPAHLPGAARTMPVFQEFKVDDLVTFFSSSQDDGVLAANRQRRRWLCASDFHSIGGAEGRVRMKTAPTVIRPIMTASTAGGGGIGMQLGHSKQELEDAFDTVKRLGANNFADDGVFIEKFIARARHIEVQVFGDGQGKAIAIGERDCSSQRRNQKVVEECPAPHLTAEVRAQLYQTAEALLSSVSYRNAGTVELIYDADTASFYFIEVNTRLQVEHGVTEEVYGVGLGEWIVGLAASEDIDIDAKQVSLKPRGQSSTGRISPDDP